MKLWLAGTIEQCAAAVRQTWIDTIVTNPTVIAGWADAFGGSIERTLTAASDRIGKPIYYQLRGPTRDAFLAEAALIRTISPYLLPKLPATIDALSATRQLSESGIPTLVTCVCSIAQGYAAATAGATSICPYWARVNESGESAPELIASLRDIFDASAVKTEILPASIRTMQDATDALEAGAHGLIIFKDLFDQLCDHPVSDASLAGFEAKDWRRLRYDTLP